MIDTIMINYKILEQMGLKENEAKIYSALLKLGETTIIPISKETKIPRTTCYFIIEKMVNNGLISQLKKGAHSYLSPASLEKITEVAILKEQKAKTQRELAEKLIPQLAYFASKSMLKSPSIQYFHGKQGIRSIFEDLLTSREVKAYYIGSLKTIVKIAGENFIKDWVKRRIKAGIFSRGIRIESEEILKTTFKSSRKNMREIRFAPKNFESPLYISIYGKKVAFITSNQEGFGLIIESIDFSTTIKSIFDIIWSISAKA